ncbi:MAG: hypothetical protein ACXABY_08740 [Candidatus Thorarchaeota archaeon]|jgi:hypothetical protein
MKKEAATNEQIGFWERAIHAGGRLSRAQELALIARIEWGENFICNASEILVDALGGDRPKTHIVDHALAVKRSITKLKAHNEALLKAYDGLLQAGWGGVECRDQSNQLSWLEAALEAHVRKHGPVFACLCSACKLVGRTIIAKVEGVESE